jgi:hypothetical protein
MKTIFIGSSSQALRYAQAVKDYFVEEQFRVELWTDITNPGEILISKLNKVISSCDYSIFLYAMDDVITSKSHEHYVVRDNVILELGISIGTLGLEKSYVIREVTDKRKTKLQSDLGGVIYTTYTKPQRANLKTIKESVRKACREIHGGIESTSNQSLSDEKRVIIYEVIEETLHTICRAAGMPKSADQFRAFYFEKHGCQLICQRHWSLHPVVNREDRVSFDISTNNKNIAVIRSGLGNPELQIDDIDQTEQDKLAKSKPVSSKLKYVISKAVISKTNEVLGVISIDTETLSGKNILKTKNHELADQMITQTSNVLSKILQL